MAVACGEWNFRNLRTAGAACGLAAANGTGFKDFTSGYEGAIKAAFEISIFPIYFL